ALVSAPPSMSGRPSGPSAPQVSRPPASGATSRRPAGSGLEVAYQRSDLEARAHAPSGPTAGQCVSAWAASFVVGLGGAAALMKVAHRAGGRSLASLLPHAFDATSVNQSGTFALVTFVLAITLGYAGLKLAPRA